MVILFIFGSLSLSFCVCSCVQLNQLPEGVYSTFSFELGLLRHPNINDDLES